MSSFLSKSERFVTTLSQQETMNIVHKMLSLKTKVLFISVANYFGTATGTEFIMFTVNSFRVRHFVPIVKGHVMRGEPTIVELKSELPVIPAFFLLVVPVIFLPVFFTMDKMMINDVLREPSLSERIGWSLFFISIPLIIFYMNYVRPLQKLRGELKRHLALKRDRRG